jgi:hypothetical protein
MNRSGPLSLRGNVLDRILLEFGEAGRAAEKIHPALKLLLAFGCFRKDFHPAHRIPDRMGCGGDRNFFQRGLL